MKTILLSVAILLSISILQAQNNLPPELQNAIPANYTVEYGLYYDGGITSGAQIELNFPGDNACDSGLEDSVNISIEILIISDSYTVQMQEENFPFASLLPTIESLQPEEYESGLVTHSETELIDIDGGRIAYYVSTFKCIMSENESFDRVSLLGLSGSHACAISIMINGPIDKDKAISMAKNLVSGFRAVNLSSPE